jgi:hypothetical protein
MNLWCSNCEGFTSFNPIGAVCDECGLPQGQVKPKRPCHVCHTEPCEPDIDVCQYCDEELNVVLSQCEFQKEYPDLCSECRVRVVDIDTGICDLCYGMIVWGAPAVKRTAPAQYDYNWWDEPAEPDLPIPSAADELETIPAMRAAA